MCCMGNAREEHHLVTRALYAQWALRKPEELKLQMVDEDHDEESSFWLSRKIYTIQKR